MNVSSKAFLFGKSENVEVVGEGITRQLLGYNDDILLARVCFDEGSIGYIHEHIHSQVTYVESGEFEVTVGEEVKTLSAGDGFYIAPNIQHGAVCKKAGVLIDVFSPVREDFLPCRVVSGEFISSEQDA